MSQVDTHLLASRDGYTTFAKSHTVTPTEQRELEELVYGQPDDASVYAALTSQATAMLRRFRSTGRYALSRIIQGDRDSASRETIAVCTIILNADQYQTIARGDLWRMLHSAQLWSIDLFRSGQPLVLPEMNPVRRAITVSDVTIFDAWMTARGRQNAVAMIGANPAAHLAIIGLTQVLAEKDLMELTWGCRLFSLPSSISLASIAQRGVEQNSRRVVVTPTTSPITPYGQRAMDLVGTNGYLTSVVAPLNASSNPNLTRNEQIQLQGDATSRLTKKQINRQKTYGSESSRGTNRSEFIDPLAGIASKKNLFYLFATVLVLSIVLLAVFILPQLLSIQGPTAQKVHDPDSMESVPKNETAAANTNTSETIADTLTTPPEVPSSFAPSTSEPSPSFPPEAATQPAENPATETIPPETTQASADPATLPSKVNDVPKWNTESYISQISGVLQELGKSKDIQAPLAKLQALITEISKFETRKIEEAVFVSGNLLYRDRYNHLLFVVRWSCKVLELSGQNSQDLAIIMEQAWSLLKKVGNERPDPIIVKSIEHFFDALQDSIQDTAIPQILPDASDEVKSGAFFEESAIRLKEANIINRCSFKNPPLILLKNTAASPLDSAENLEHSFLEMPFYSIVMVFHKPFGAWLTQRKQFVNSYDTLLKKSDLKMTKSGESVEIQRIDKIRKSFPWEKIPMPIDTEIAAFKGCPIPLVNSLAESAQQLIDKCDAAAKISKKSGTKSE